MGFLSKIWKGVKKVVKKAAKTIKKVAKKVVTALPGGKKLWKLGTKIGQGIIKGIGKITSALGPVGMIALSVLAPYAAPLWASFGAASAAAGGILGSIGTAVYSAGNWVAATLGSMSQGISKAFGTIAEGGFKGLGTSLGKAGSEAVSGFAKAFTGEAGAAGIKAGVSAASDFALKEAAGQSLLDQTVSKITGDVAGTSTIELTNENINRNLEALNPATQGNMSFDLGKTDFNIAEQAANQFAPQTLETQGLNIIKGKVATSGGSSSLLNKATTVAKDLLSGGGQEGQLSSLQAVGDVGGRTFGGNAQAQGGLGSGGGNFLSQAMLKAMEQQTRRMTRGFG